MRLEVIWGSEAGRINRAADLPAAAVIEFLSRIVMLEPGDLISTGTLAGVGSTTGTFLKPGDLVSGWIERIGTVTNPVEVE